MNNFEEVEAMATGTVFQFEDGAPWVRSDIGVLDLVYFSDYSNRPIPEIWKTYDYKLNILYRPEED